MITIFILLVTLFLLTVMCMLNYYINQSLKSEFFNGMVDLAYTTELLNRIHHDIDKILQEYNSKSIFNFHASTESYFLLEESVLHCSEFTNEQRIYLLHFFKRYYKIILSYNTLEELKREISI